MEKKYPKNNKFKSFLKKNMYYVIMAVCIAAIGTMVTVALVSKSKTPIDVVVPPIDDGSGDVGGGGDIIPDPPVVVPPVVFLSPVANGTILVDYARDYLVFNPTLNQYQVHKGIDFGGAEGALVLAAYDGVVESVSYDKLNGTVIVIKHKDDIRTSYSSLKDPTVAIGDTITKGMTIGAISTSATNEMASGAHVHFCVTKANVIVNPHDFLPEGDK